MSTFDIQGTCNTTGLTFEVTFNKSIDNKYVLIKGATAKCGPLRTLDCSVECKKQCTHMCVFTADMELLEEVPIADLQKYCNLHVCLVEPTLLVINYGTESRYLLFKLTTREDYTEIRLHIQDVDYHKQLARVENELSSARQLYDELSTQVVKQLAEYDQKIKNLEFMYSKLQSNRR